MDNVFMAILLLFLDEVIKRPTACVTRAGAGDGTPSDVENEKA